MIEVLWIILLVPLAAFALALTIGIIKGIFNLFKKEKEKEKTYEVKYIGK